MSVGLSYLAKVVQDRQVLNFVNNEVSKDDFIADEIIIYDFISRHIQQYGVVPDKITIERETEKTLPEIPNEPLEYWITSLKSRTMGFKLRAIQTPLATAINNGEYENAAEIISGAMTEIMNTTPDADRRIRTLGEISEEVITQHDARQQGLTNRNVPYGFPYLDQISDGLEKGDTIALVGQKGVGKSYILCRMALSAYEAGYTPLFVSMEMTAEQMARRLLSLKAKIPENAIRRGNLSTYGGREKVLTAFMELDTAERPFHIIDGRFVLKIDELISYCRAVKPDVLYIDGAYLLKASKSRASDNKWDLMADITEQLKLFAGFLRIPVLGTYQMKKDKSMYGSKAVEQLASVVLNLSDVKDNEDDSGEWKYIDYKRVDIVKGRYGERGSFKLKYSMHLDVGITQDEIIQNYLTGADNE